VLPRFKHECTSCKFLGQYYYHEDPNGRQEYDLYVCGGVTPTVIARFSDYPPDYMSSGIHAGLISNNVNGINPTYPLSVALNRAIYEGYLKISATSKLKWEEIKQRGRARHVEKEL